MPCFKSPKYSGCDPETSGNHLSAIRITGLPSIKYLSGLVTSGCIK